MIDPPGTNWPPKAFTPSRCAFESRPFFELPKPFLCAMTGFLYAEISFTFTRVKFWRCPMVRLYCFLRLELEDDDFGAAVVRLDRLP